MVRLGLPPKPMMATRLLSCRHACDGLRPIRMSRRIVPFFSTHSKPGKSAQGEQICSSGKLESNPVCPSKRHIQSAPPSAASASFWNHRETWIHAAANTARCLVGCSVGDLGMLFLTQAYGCSTSTSMALSMASGLSTSFALETFWLRAVHGMALAKAAETAFGMSAISMLSMEAAENVVELALTGGQFAPGEPWWWGALGASLAVGFVTPLPYNYYMLRRHGKSCH